MYAQTNKVLLVALVSAAMLHGNAAKRVSAKIHIADEVAGNVDDCKRVSKNVRLMAELEGTGSTNWQGVYKCLHPEKGVVVIQCAIDGDEGERKGTPQCWVESQPSDLENLWNGIVHIATDTATAVASLFLPQERPDSDLDAAIGGFMKKAGGEAAEMKADIADMKQTWQTMSAFEKEITVLLLKYHNAGGSALVQVAEGEQKTQGFWQDLFRFIGALFKAGENNRRRAAANHYMGMNIGWDHVRSNMRADGWRWY